MPDSATRRAKMKAHLQNKLINNRAQAHGALTPSEIEKLCQEDVRRLATLVSYVTDLGCPDMDSPLWTTVVTWMEGAVDFITAACDVDSRFKPQMPLLVNTNPAQKRQSAAEAKVIIARLKARVAQLPPTCRLHDPGRLGLHPLEHATRTAIANSGTSLDRGGVHGFMAVVRDFGRLGIPMEPHIARATGPPLSATEWQSVLDSMEPALFTFKIEQHQLPNAAKSQKQTMATIKRLEKWLASARSRFIDETGELTVSAEAFSA